MTERTIRLLPPPDSDPIKPKFASPGRVLWGTDFPHPNVKWMPNDGELVDLFARTCDDDGLRRKILVDNPTRLYWA